MRLRRLLGPIAATLFIGCQVEVPVAEITASPATIPLDHGRYTEIALEWRMLKELGPGGESPIVFVHLSQPEEGVLRTFDHSLGQPWRVGKTIRYTLPLSQSALGPALKPGRYDLSLGLYDGADHRWPLGCAEEVARQAYLIATVEVETEQELPGEEAPDEEVRDVELRDVEVPRFVFSDSWSAVEPGSNAQILARRWMFDPGWIQVEGMPKEAKQLRIALLVPQAVGNLRLALAEGAHEPIIRLTTDCSGFEATLVGEGQHVLEIPIAPGSCRLDLSSNFHVVQLETLEQVVLAIEGLAWR